MATAEINGVELFHTEAGSGPPCLVMHGGLGLDHIYMRTLAPLATSLRFVYYDQRGNGRSGRPPLETISLPQLADDAEGLREHLGLERTAVLGHSYGGFVALEYATRYPDRLSHLLLLDTSPGDFRPTRHELAERPDPSTVAPEAVAATERLFSTVPASDEEFAKAMPELARAYVRTVDPSVLGALFADTVFDVRTMVRGFEAFGGWSVAEKLDRIECPTFVVCGRYDLQTTPECAKRLETAIPDAELVWFENSGHFPWVEEPTAFFNAVKDWLDRHP